MCTVLLYCTCHAPIPSTAMTSSPSPCRSHAHVPRAHGRGSGDVALKRATTWGGPKLARSTSRRGRQLWEVEKGVPWKLDKMAAQEPTLRRSMTAHALQRPQRHHPPGK